MALHHVVAVLVFVLLAPRIVGTAVEFNDQMVSGAIEIGDPPENHGLLTEFMAVQFTRTELFPK